MINNTFLNLPNIFEYKKHLIATSQALQGQQNTIFLIEKERV